MEGATKSYIVNYEINSVGNASTALRDMAEQALAASANLNKVVAQVKAVNSYVKLLSKNESLNNLWNIKPTVNLDQAKTGLRQLETLAQESASRIQGIMSKAMAGVSSGNGLYSPKDKALIQAKMKQLEDEFKTITNGRAKITDKTAKGRNGITESAAQLRKDYQDYAKQLASIQKFEKATQEPGAATSLRSFVNRADDIKAAANRITNLTNAVNKFNTLKGGKSIRIDANIKPAMAKIQNLLNAVREGYAAINIGVTDKAVGKKGKEINSNGTLTNLGKANAAAAQNATITKATDAAKKSMAALEQRLLGNVRNLQETANNNTIKITSTFNGGNAAFQLQQSLTRLQELANGRPINVTARMATNAINIAVSQANAAAAKGKGSSLLKPINLGVKLSSTGLASQINEIAQKAREYANRANISIKVGVRAGALSKGIKDIVSQAQNTATSKAGVKLKATLQLNTQSLSAQLSKAIAQLQAEADKKPLNIKSTLNGTTLLSQLNSTVASLEKAISKFSSIRTTQSTVGTRQPAASTSSSRVNISTVGRATPSVRSVQSGNDYYSRIRSLWYPFTGNTSFGARTPMMVDMAKGMGTMFAVGGAMSAVGSSIRQAVQYQNQMRTTKAILENGTETYTPEGFVNMEKTVRDVGKKTKFTAPDVANAARFMAMAGLGIPAINAAIRPVADIALIGDTDLGTTADKLTNVMTTFGIAPEKMRDVADIMTSTFTRTNTDMMMLAESAKYAGGIANLYGGNFKNNFADVMAIFGVLGNAGIQASSAGTTVRMMYQNLMQPNKKQREALNKYGIQTRDSNGQPLEMVNIIHQFHEKIPMNQMADAIGTMFRITAQPGAATLAAHVDTLDRIMQANRSAAGTNISGEIAFEKQNTISGLWAQVTSTFTEAVVQAFENREGGWAGTLKKLRDYLAKPETIQMISKIIDLVENLATTMAKFAKVWTTVYSTAPKLINAWLHLQLVFTQIGYLATPIISMIGVFSTLKTLLYGVSSAGAAANTSLARNVAAGGGLPIFTTAATRNAARLRNTQNSYKAFRVAQAEAASAVAANASLVAANAPRKQLLAQRQMRYMQISNRLENSLPTSMLLTGMTLDSMGRYTQGRQTYQRYGLRYSAHDIARQGQNLPYSPALQWHDNAMRQAQFSDRAAADAARMQGQIDALSRQEAASSATVLAAQQRAMTARTEWETANRVDQLANKELLRRYYRMGGKGALGLGMKGAFQRGMSMGAIGLSATGMFGGIKNAFFSLMTGLSKAVGLLVSPVGLAVTGITILGGSIYKLYKDFKERKEQLAIADQNSNWAAETNNNLYKHALNNSIEIGGIKPIEIGYSKPESSETPTYSLEENATVANILQKSDKLTGSEIINRYAKDSDIYIPKDEIESFKRYNPDYIDDFRSYDDKVITTVKALNKVGAENARKLAVIGQWDKLAVEQKDFLQAQKDLQQALSDNNTDRVNNILESYMPFSQMRMENLENAQKISEISDPTKYYEWQNTQYEALIKTANKYRLPNQYRQAAIEQIDIYNYLKKKNLASSFDASLLAQDLLQSKVIEFQGKTAAITLATDENGNKNIDWVALANSVNNGIPLSIKQQLEILQKTYDEIYNDPNVKNVTEIVSLLQEYLPRLTQMQPYNSVIYQTFPQNKEASMWASGEAVGSPNHDEWLKNHPINFAPIDFNQSTLGLNVNKKGAIYGNGLKSVNDYNFMGSLNNKNKYSPIAPLSVSPALYSGKPNNLKSGNGVSSNNSKNSQKDYASTYNRNAAKPTQVIINIENLARFDRTAIASGAEERDIVAQIETKIAEAVMMLSSTALNEAGSIISQGVS